MNYRSFENEDMQGNYKIDLMTWRQIINNALKRSHGIFGEGIEYFFLNQDDKIAYLKVCRTDKEIFSSGISSYISGESLIGVPLVVTILQEESNLEKIQVSDDDKLWFHRVLENEFEETQCS